MIGPARGRPGTSEPANALGVAAVPDAGRSHQEASRRPLATESRETLKTNRDDRPGPWVPFNPTIARPPGRPSRR